MNLSRLLLRNLFYHWRGNLAVFLGVSVGAAVLTGALLLGDSLRGSLRDLTLERLGWVDRAMVASRFLRDEYAREIPTHRACPAVLLQGSAASASGKRAGRTTILGVDERFWNAPVPINPEFWQSSRNEAVINTRLADELDVRPGDTMELNVQKASAIPRETLLGRRDTSAVLEKLQVTVREVLPNAGMAVFSLSPSPETPKNLFLPLKFLQSALNQPGRANAFLLHSSTQPESPPNLDDWGLVVHDPETRTESLFEKLDRNGDGLLKRNEYQNRVATAFERQADTNSDGILSREEVLAYYQRRGYFSLESRQMLVEPAVVQPALEAAAALKLRAAPTLVYLANTIADGNHQVPYSVVAGLNPALAAPLGPFLPLDTKDLGDGEIVLVDWKESPLQAKPGDDISLTYFVPKDQGQLGERTEKFRLRGMIPIAGPAADPDLTPDFPGFTDKLDIRDWDPPFPYDNKRVKPVDERYWHDYRTIPKAYVNLATAQRLWGNRFGNLTSIRLAPPAGTDLTTAAREFRERLLLSLDPNKGGMAFDSVRERLLQSSAGGQDFGTLFLGFSTFLIAAALLLVGLLFRLNLDRRAAEIGVLLASGYRRATVRWLLLAEGELLAAAGGLLGLLAAVGYAYLMMDLLAYLWPGGLSRSFLRLHVEPASLALGFIASLAVSMLTIAWALRLLSRVPPRALLGGETVQEDAVSLLQPSRWGRRIGVGAGVLGLALIIAGGWVRDHQMQAFTFFGGGMMLLTAALALVWWWMRGSGHRRVHGRGTSALARLGIRNAARYPLRSLLTAGLLAASAFLIVAVESFRRQPVRNFLDRNSGSGGFVLLGESDAPVFQDLNSSQGKDEILEVLETRWRQQPSVESEGVKAKLQTAQQTLQRTAMFSFRLRSGDDASCLNLYKPTKPRLLGVPQSLIDRGGFRFAGTEAKTPEEKANPWTLLNRDGPEIPVFGEQNTVTWMLGSSLGGVIQVQDEQGKPVNLRIIGLLKDSVFQRELLMSEANFLRLFPSHAGYNFFLIDTPGDSAAAAEELLEGGLGNYGFEATPTTAALASFLAVENTYLSTFQVLGGLGLLLGALGLAVVLIRGVWERRGELALLRALGFRQAALGWLVLAENGFLLVLGLAMGTVSALLAVAPHVLETHAGVPWLRLAGMLGLVLAAGLTAGALATRSSLRTPLLPALRKE